jgi:hypothetical protein
MFNAQLSLLTSPRASPLLTDSLKKSKPNVWCQAPVWGPRPDFCNCQTVACLLMWGAHSDEKTGLSSTITVGPHHFGFESCRTHDHCSRFETPPDWRARSTHLCPPGTGWLSYRHWVHFSSPRTTPRATVEGGGTDSLLPRRTVNHGGLTFLILCCN